PPGKTADFVGLSQVPGIDIIVGGHSHDALAQPLAAGGKLIVQAGEFGRYLGELKVDVGGGAVNAVSYKLYPVDRSVPQDPTLLPLLSMLKAGIVADPRFGPVYTKLVAWAERDLERRWVEAEPERDTGLGNLVTDAMRKGVHGYGFPADIALEANGYLGAKILAGKVVGNDILRAVPYGYDPASGLGFKVHCVLIAGAQLLAGLEYSLTYVEYTDEISMQVSGFRFAYDSRNPPSGGLGQLSRLDPASVRIHGQPITPEGLYWVALNEQLYKSLVALGLQPFSHVDTGLFEYNLVRSFMMNLNQVDYEAEGRIIDRKYKTSALGERLRRK
ncbi:MAG: 5'-nucleotidase C-terminal domain-containing protein, partial [Candidatus Aminicenantes bacterium]|nr:5'-nucleotidase C-terminal domain-containing protein [Candidatus Aminicenantes bacterium]